MLTIYENRSGALERQKGKPRMTETAVWVDLLNPTPEEEKQIERALKLDVPTREEQQEIEVSSRLYQEGGAYFMTATLMYQPEEGEPRMTPVTFILAGQRLITLRYAEPRAFSLYVARCNRAETDLKTGAAILIGLLDTIIDRPGAGIGILGTAVDNNWPNAPYDDDGDGVYNERDERDMIFTWVSNFFTTRQNLFEMNLTVDFCKTPYYPGRVLPAKAWKTESVYARRQMIGVIDRSTMLRVQPNGACDFSGPADMKLRFTDGERVW